MNRLAIAGGLVGALLFLGSTSALADGTSPAAASASSLAMASASAVASTAAPSVGGCVETLPAGTTRPKLEEVFPSRGLSGYAVPLEVTVEHGKGESVLPNGISLQHTSDAAKVLRTNGFEIPNQDGGAAATLTPVPNKDADRAKTKLTFPLVALPKEPGRRVLELPPMPIAIARASGEMMTVCTLPHRITIEDPIAGVPNAEPKANPPPRVQREEWTTLKRATQWALAGIAIGALLAYGIYRWSKRPKAVPPPPPPRPPWEIALEKLHEIRHAGLLQTGRFAEYFDRVNDAVRAYLGARYGFDGLESTTDETLAALERVPHLGVSLAELRLFFQSCDLVKFANMIPTIDECERAMSEGERIVRATMLHVHAGVPHIRVDVPSAGPPMAGAGGAP